MVAPYSRHNDGRTPMSPPSYNGARSPIVPNHNAHISPPTLPGKSVTFELIVTTSSRYTARLPMKVKVHSHDTLESIVTTVRNFYGLYNNPSQSHGRAISFEDKEGNTLIVRYENLNEGMTVYVRVNEDPIGAVTTYDPHSYDTHAKPQPASYDVDNVYHMPPPQPAKALNYGQVVSRPASRTSQARSASPVRGRRRDSLQTESVLPTKKARSRSGFQNSRPSSTHGNSFDNIHSDGLTGYSSGDGASGSVSSKANMGNTEISLDNIVEGGRRKRAKFESSELPLFAPPQMPAATSNSSVSPVRRIEQHRASYPFPQSIQHPFSNPQPMQSPQSYNNGFGQPGLYATPAHGSRRLQEGEPSSRSSYGSTPNGNVSGILPTPDPTVGSCMSEEDKDVAIQLMRLGDMSNLSHGRTSATTLDDGFSGRADATSSAGATSESDSEAPLAKRPKREPSPILPPGMNRSSTKQSYTNIRLQESPESVRDNDSEYRPERRHDEFLNDVEHLLSSNTPASMAQNTTRMHQGLPSGNSYKTIKPSTISGKPRTALPSALPASSKIKAKSHSVSENPMSPNSMTSHSRKVSIASALNFQHQLGDDEEDLSSKPRCQRCRKSKKGCDRQRPCQRCKDAGLNADQCISEDEGNGRKGRYGRHMGVSVKKDDVPVMTGAPMEFVVGQYGQQSDKNKKRKR